MTRPKWDDLTEGERLIKLDRLSKLAYKMGGLPGFARKFFLHEIDKYTVYFKFDTPKLILRRSLTEVYRLLKGFDIELRLTSEIDQPLLNTKAFTWDTEGEMMVLKKFTIHDIL
jgi:hypothetical protein